jgi:hypothetical protein
VDFFEPPPRRPEPPQSKRYRTPEWSGPPVAPGVAALDLVLVNTGELAIFVSGPAPWSRDDPPSDGAVLVARGGSGGERRWEQRLWAWPLPPPGEEG